MILKRSLSVVAVMLALASQGSANLLTNPGFESDLGSEWAFTAVSGTLPWVYEKSNIRYHDGSYSLRMAYGYGDAVGKAYVEQVISGLTPGVPCDISGWVNMDWRATKATAFIEVLGGGAAVQAPAQGGNTDDVWQQWTLSQTADSSGNLTVRLYLDKYATTAGGDKTAVAYYDEVSVVEVPDPASMLLLLTGSLGLAALKRRR